jgi:hypothetical protein
MESTSSIQILKEARTANRRLAQWRLTWLIEHSTSHQLLWCIDSFVLRNPPLRQAPKRYKMHKQFYNFNSTWTIKQGKLLPLLNFKKWKRIALIGH